jgi:hypothetical protein
VGTAKNPKSRRLNETPFADARDEQERGPRLLLPDGSGKLGRSPLHATHRRVGRLRQLRGRHPSVRHLGWRILPVRPDREEPPRDLGVRGAPNRDGRGRPRAAAPCRQASSGAGSTRNTHARWHENVLAGDIATATRIARARAAAHGIHLVVAAVIGPNSSVVADPHRRASGSVEGRLSSARPDRFSAVQLSPASRGISRAAAARVATPQARGGSATRVRPQASTVYSSAREAKCAEHAPGRGLPVV